jgi:hypothetical protein|tara:strand:- start:5178 stop:5663 length:486 start_codon:yes stop_codon:yes gene_type:complete
MQRCPYPRVYWLKGCLLHRLTKKGKRIMPRKKTTSDASSKKPAKRASAKKKPVQKLNQTHGKQEYQPVTLDQIWGDDGMGKYKTLKEEEYEQELNGMTRTDLHAHASKVGLIPIENTDQLKKRLMNEFKKHVAQYTKPVSQAAQKSLKLSKEAQKILEEGR